MADARGYQDRLGTRLGAKFHLLRLPRRRATVHACMAGAPSDSPAWLLPFAVLEHLLNLLLDCIEVEGRRVLHRRIIDRRRAPPPDALFHPDEAPELTGEELIHVAWCTGVQGLAAKGRRSLERVLANVDQPRHVRGGLFARPAPRLHKERELEVVEANGAELRAAEIEQLAAL